MSRAAVIVIGSNSTRCVAGDFSRAQEDVIRRRIETRLFLHMKDGVLADADIVETAAGIARLKAVSDAPVLGIYATSAVRDAKKPPPTANSEHAKASPTMMRPVL